MRNIYESGGCSDSETHHSLQAVELVRCAPLHAPYDSTNYSSPDSVASDFVPSSFCSASNCVRYFSTELCD